MTDTHTFADPMDIHAWPDGLLQASSASDPDGASTMHTAPQATCTASALPLHHPLRIVSIERTLDATGQIHNRADLFHCTRILTVSWTSQHSDTRLRKHGLATIRPAGHSSPHQGCLRIDRLLPADKPESVTNLFHTVPPSWVRDAALVSRAAALWERLPRSLAGIFNAIFWDSGRIHRYVMGPSSLIGHHNRINGNFEHSVDVAETALALAERVKLADPALLVLGGLLHDAAKADEYQYHRNTGRFSLSPRGELVGHRETLIEWLAVARQQVAGGMPEALYLGLRHLLGAVKGAPRWTGVREPRSVEAEILVLADRLSGLNDLHERCAPSSPGFGAHHPHLGQRTYVTRRAA